MADEDKKKGFFDRVKDAVDQIMPGQQPAAKPQQPRRPSSRTQVDGFARTGELGRAKATGGLAAPPTGQLEAQQPAGPPDEVLSPRRLAMIEDYMKGEYKIDAMRDPAYMYKIVSDERAYQTRMLFEMRKKLQTLPQGHPQATDLQEKIKRAQTITTNLFKVLKRITGAEGSTGGTDFLSDKK